MYNCYQARRKTLEISKLCEKQQSNRHWEQHYQNKIRPKLLQRYNKRIKTFIRKMEQHPIILTNIYNSQRDGKEKKFQFHDKKTFIYKNQKDWISLLTPTQRIDRQQNLQYMRKKFGDYELANRGLVSQSVYNTKVEYRIRNKVKQINPPMSYSHKITKTQIENIRISKKMHTNNSTKNKSKVTKNPQIQISLKRKNSASSQYGSSAFFHEDMKSNTDESIKDQSMGENQLKSTKPKMDDNRIYFKRIIDLSCKIKDIQEKKTLKELLIRCGVFKLKNNKMKLDSDIDRFSELQTKTVLGHENSYDIL